jgi:hypothetical protein
MHDWSLKQSDLRLRNEGKRGFVDVIAQKWYQFKMQNISESRHKNPRICHIYRRFERERSYRTMGVKMNVCIGMRIENKKNCQNLGKKKVRFDGEEWAKIAS